MNLTPRQPSKNVLYFAKYHGAGNDFIMVDGIKYPDTPSWWHRETIYKLCSRRFGVGADGLIVLLPSEECDYRMKYFNSDGVEAQMCGNGLRCLALFIRDQGHRVSSPMSIQTLAGGVTVDILAGERVRVGMPGVSFERKDLPMRGKGECINEELKIDTQAYRITALSVGNPHVVLFGDYTDEQVSDLGPKIETHELFPQRTNVHFVKIAGIDRLEQKIWERGCGRTLACGSGAVAAAAAAIVRGLMPAGVPLRVQQPGGELTVAVADQFRESSLEGEAVYVYHGVVEF
ncbi:MAG: diaminopimelate epimerase [Candidatus Zixiibacteriota bacterium]|nr:MAG: diaminopimelate epimerase [candidate division Zixibacteria bacterium]